MRVNKRVFLGLVSLLVILVISCIALTMAYLTDKRESLNLFEMGTVKIEIQEPGWEGTATNPKLIKLDSVVTKDPLVKNIGEEACFVRATVTFSDAMLQPGLTIADFITFIGMNTTNWEVDGTYTRGDTEVVFYYKGILEPGKSTEKIFTGVKLHSKSAGGDNLLEGAFNGFDVQVSGEAVQTKDENGKVFASAKAAFDALL